MYNNVNYFQMLTEPLRGSKSYFDQAVGIQKMKDDIFQVEMQIEATKDEMQGVDISKHQNFLEMRDDMDSE
jgi:hypothetical protein